ncbi:TonB-dependent receptor [Compostibacter hankyongensis]|uniref:TonB-dependent receptor n=2 Tax=Compostibacter hankyongensis TaxID=1007089 RepID=A0ABP8G200_9BACT
MLLGTALLLPALSVCPTALPGKILPDQLQTGHTRISVNGTITDESGNPVPGATVVEKGTQNGTVSGDDGRYRINVDENAVLIFKAIGWQETEISVNGREKVDAVLKGSTTKLNEVVAIGYGKQSKRTLTTAVSKIDGKILENTPINNVGDGLKGRVAGARIYTNNFTPGADPVIRIRGGSSINKSNNPLVLIDGVEGSLADINPNDIASVDVLKDAASTAIYGSRASNGVVLVTTKTGKQDRAPRVTFQSDFAREAIETSYDFMNAKDYLSYVRPAVALSPNPKRNDISGFSASSGNTSNSAFTTHYLKPGEAAPQGWKTMPDPLDPSKTLVFQDNSFKDVIYRPALWQNYYVGVTGGTDKIKYAGSAGYTDDGGVALATGWTRFSTRANVEVNISKRLQLTSNMNYSESKSQEYDNQKNIIARGLASAPTQRIYWDDGRPAPGFNATAPNPAWYAYITDQSRRDQQTGIQEMLSWNVLNGLTVKVNGSYYTQTMQSDFFQKANEFSGSRKAESGFSQNRQAKLESYFTYDKYFGGHSFNLTGGYSYLNIDDKTLSAAAQGGNTDKIPTLNAAPDKTDASTYITKEVLIGYFGRLSYDFNKKYLLSLSFREDGSSRFISGNQWGFFPGASAGWIVSEEPFMKSLRALSFLKLRASYGLTGNNSIGLYDAQGEYSVDYIYDGHAGIRSTSMPNNNLTWESTKQLDLGAEIGLFDNRLNATFDYYDKRTQNLLFSKELPNTSGYASVESNVGKVRFYGFDIDISSVNIQHQRFSWNSSFTWSFSKNRVLKLPDNGRTKNRIGGIAMPDGNDYGGIAEGESLYRFYGYNVAYILQNQAQADKANYDELARGWSPADQKRVPGRKLPGDYEWADRNGDGIINSLDQFELGVTVPVSTGGLDNKFTYKNWSLDIYLDWGLGHAIFDEAFMRYFMNTFSYNYALVDDVKQTWKGPDDLKAKYARLTANDPDDGNNNFGRASDVFTYKGDYLCLRNVILSYQLPAGFLKKYTIKGASLYISGNTLYYFTAVKGVSPEEGSASTYNNNYYNYPPVRKYAFGIKVTF